MPFGPLHSSTHRADDLTARELGKADLRGPDQLAAAGLVDRNDLVTVAWADPWLDAWQTKVARADPRLDAQPTAPDDIEMPLPTDFEDLPDIANLASVATLIAMLQRAAIEQNLEMRDAYMKMYFEQRELFMKKADDVLKKQLAAAEKNFWAGMMNSVGSVAGGMAQLGGAFKAWRSMAKANDAQHSAQLGNHSVDKLKADRLNKKIEYDHAIGGLEKNRDAAVLRRQEANELRQNNRKELQARKQELADLEAEARALGGQPSAAAKAKLKTEIKDGEDLDAALKADVSRQDAEVRHCNDQIKAKRMERDHDLAARDFRIKEAEGSIKTHGQDVDMHTRLMQMHTQIGAAFMSIIKGFFEAIGAGLSMQGAQLTAHATRDQADQEAATALGQIFKEIADEQRDAAEKASQTLGKVNETMADSVRNNVRSFG